MQRYGRIVRHTAWWISCLAVLLLTGCSVSIQAKETPAAVHERWVAALQENDRSTALALAAHQEQRDAFVDTQLRTMQAKRDPASATGPLQRTSVRPLTDSGTDKQGISVWHFANRTECWRTTLIDEEGIWKVLRWGQVTPCITT